MKKSATTLTLMLLSASLTVAQTHGQLSQLRVAGNRIVDESGQSVRLRGVNVACLEWTSDGEGHILDTERQAIKDWHANILRVPLSQDRWFGQGPEQRDGGIAYRDLVKKVVDYGAENKTYILLDLHWNDAGIWGSNIGQHVMPDMNGITFWRDCARTFRNQPAVLFDLYNEPHDTTWQTWLMGGQIVETRGPGARQGKFLPVTYKTPGMQALLDAIRSTGADNLVVCGGLDWAYDLAGMLKGFVLKDPSGRGVVYACHTYPMKGDSVSQWVTKLDRARPVLPLIMSEFGSQNRGKDVDKPNPWVSDTLKAMEDRKCSWIAWDLHPSAGPTLIKDWTYAPTPSFGNLVKNALAR